MNYYNPYFYSMPITNTVPKVGLFSKLFGSTGITFKGILSGTQSALNFANQAIPLVKQVKPMIGNAKTMFKVMSEFKKEDISNRKKILNQKAQENTVQVQTTYYEGPKFFA